MYRNILFAVDLNHESSWQKALPVALEYCKAFSAQLHVMTVVAGYFHLLPGDVEQRTLEQVDQQLHAFVQDHIPADVSVHPIVAEGTAYKEIIRVAEEVNADLIVMASHHPELKDYLIEPNAERVVRHSDRWVLVVRN